MSYKVRCYTSPAPANSLPRVMKTIHLPITWDLENVGTELYMFPRSRFFRDMPNLSLLPQLDFSRYDDDDDDDDEVVR